MARLDIKDEVKEEIDKVIETKKINEKIYVTNEVVIKSKYFPNIEKGLVVSINITSSDITEKYYSQIKMVELSLRDDLTGFYNSKAFNKHLDSMEKESLLAVVYIDINGLKFMNDAFGHDAGDILITSVADEIKEHFVFDNSVVYRLGGDEFVIIIRNKNYDEINQLMKKLETAVNKKVLKGIPTSISVGLAIAKDNDSIESLIKKAESVMYNQKIIHHKRAPFKNIESSMNIITNKDSKMKQHLENVEKLSVLLGEKIKLNAYDMTLLRSLAKYHDIGKINISDDLFNNDNRKLNKEEMVELKKQAETGYRILSRTPQFYDIAFDNLAQYENYDGTGHFRGIKGTNIPIKARIIRIVNYYDLLTHYYNQSKSDALSYLVSESGKKFDPNLVKLLVEIIENKEEL